MTNDKEKYNVEILEEDHSQFDLSFKLIVIGDSGVGKSCLTMKATKDIFNEESQATVGFEFYSFNMKINDKIIKLQIWDTCGQEVYRSLISNFYRNAGLAIIVYSITSEKSFENINLWLKELKNHSSPDIKVIIIGNKLDLEQQRQVSKEQADIFSKQVRAELLLEASAKSGTNTKDIFIQAGKILYDDLVKYGSNKSRSSFDSDIIEASNKKIKIPQNKTFKPKKEGCCK